MAIRFRSNHSIGLVLASSFTLVGCCRVSIGPAISVIVRGEARLWSSAMTATAVSTATTGWQTASTCPPGPIASMNWMMCATNSSSPKRPSLSGTSRALCQSVM